MYATLLNLNNLVLPELPFLNPYTIRISLFECSSEDLVMDWSRDDAVTSIHRPKFEVPKGTDEILDAMYSVVVPLRSLIP